MIETYRDKPGALIPVLQMAQGIFGYLPEVALKRVARGMSKPYSEVAGVVGFYSFFSTVPRGRNLIRVCLGTACYVRGGMAVLEALKKELGIDVGETTEDREFSLEVARCFGACGLAPVITINDVVHHRVKPARISEILAQYAPESDVGRRSRRKERVTMADKIKSPADLLAMAGKAKEDIDLRSGAKEIKVTVHMGTCGIAAGARDVVVAFLTEIADAKLDNVTIHQSGCAGLCEMEPMATVQFADGAVYHYGHLEEPGQGARDRAVAPGRTAARSPSTSSSRRSAAQR